jgi:hypothetical protein
VTTISESLRAPAEMPQKGYVKLIARAVASRFWPARLCFHRHLGIPVNNRQNCMDCGATRLYLFHSDFEHADAGIVTGPWTRPSLPAQDAHRIVARNLLTDAVAAGRALAATKQAVTR